MRYKSNLAIVFLSALTGIVGKAIGGQIEWIHLAAVRPRWSR